MGENCLHRKKAFDAGLQSLNENNCYTHWTECKALGHELYLKSFSKLVIGLILDRFGIKLVSQIHMELSGVESLTTSPKAHLMLIKGRRQE